MLRADAKPIGRTRDLSRKMLDPKTSQADRVLLLATYAIRLGLYDTPAQARARAASKAKRRVAPVA